MRNLSKTEIEQLENQHCTCNDWTKISVNDNFNATHIRNSQFSGNVTLGFFDHKITNNASEEFHTGIFNSQIHNCIIGDNSFISNSRIANYRIGNNCIVEDTPFLKTVSESTFGNGTTVCVLNESGGREVRIFENLSVHTAYLLTFYRHREKMIENINRLVDLYCDKKRSCSGTIGDNVTIKNCTKIQDTNIADFATLDNVCELDNGTVISDDANKTFVGNGVIAKNFIFGKGSKIYDYVLIDNSYIGEACEIGKQYSAVDSLIFCNSQLFHGEACAIFAGPYTTSHHKATLLIGCAFSFYNAGSGTNQSNHMYKLGPVHQGVLERGSKTGSDSYMMLETRTGAFSVVLGHHEKHFDTSNLPFSYILNDEGKSTLVPAINLLTIGTQRDAKKWATRDKRNGKNLTDFIIFDMFNPYTIGKIKCGIETLNEMQQSPSAFHLYKNVRIKDIFVQRGISIYKNAITLYLGEKLTEKLSANAGKIDWTTNGEPLEKWVDCSGLVIPQKALNEMLTDIENGKICDLTALNTLWAEIQQNFAKHEWAFVCQMLEWLLQKNCNNINNDDLKQLLSKYQEALNSQLDSVLADAEKEFDSPFQVGFGIDDEDTKLADFSAVRGTKENNSVLKKLREEFANKNDKAENAKGML